MENPGILLRRASEARARRAHSARTGGALPAAEAPAPRKDATEPRAKPLPPLSHANYSALMRNHDRARTRHLSAKA